MFFCNARLPCNVDFFLKNYYSDDLHFSPFFVRTACRFLEILYGSFSRRFPPCNSFPNDIGPLQTAAPQHSAADGDIRGPRTRVPHHRVVSTQTTNATTENGRW